MSEITNTKQQRWVKLFVNLVLFIVTIAFFYVFFARPLKTIFEYVIYFVAPTYAMIFCYLIYSFFKEGYKKENVFPLIFLPLPFAIGFINIYAVGVLLLDIFNIIYDSKLPIDLKAVISASFTLFVGTVFFIFRKFRRSTYGLLEIIIGFVIGYNLVIQYDMNMTSDKFYVPFLVSSVYLVVRGMDNFEHGITKTPIDPWIKKLVSIIHRA